MRLYQIQAEWQRAQQALRAADLLQVHGLTADAVSRAYYATMHAAKAALLVHDVITESHSAVRRLFGQILIQPGELEKTWADILAEEYAQRGTADYNAGAMFEVGETAQLVHDAHHFVERIAHYLASQGVSLEPSEESPPA